MMILLILSAIFILSSSVEAVMPDYLPVNRAVSRNDAIENYFTFGFTASEILSFLLTVHGIRLSLRQLRRFLKTVLLYGRTNFNLTISHNVQLKPAEKLKSLK